MNLTRICHALTVCACVQNCLIQCLKRLRWLLRRLASKDQGLSLNVIQNNSSKSYVCSETETM